MSKMKPISLNTVYSVKVQKSDSGVSYEVKLASGQTLTANTENVENLEIVGNRIFSTGNLIAGFKYAVGGSLLIGTLNVSGAGLTPTAAINAWRKAALECVDSGIKIPFLEFVADAISIEKNKHSAVKTSFNSYLVNCFTRVVVDGTVLPESELYSFRQFVEFYGCDETQRIWMVSRFYVNSGYKISNSSLLKVFEHYASSLGYCYSGYTLE